MMQDDKGREIIEIKNIDTARELLSLMGYPVYKTKWVTWGGGHVQEFDTDEEVITFARDMQKSVKPPVDEMLVWAGSTCRARCGCCTLFREKDHWCNAGVRNPVFYNTPTFGCEAFDDDGKEIRK